MTRHGWRFLDSGPAAGAENMAMDEAMLEAHLAGETPPTLRVYGWRPPAVSVGRFQRVRESVDLDACRRLGFDVVRRPTGGRAILHSAEEVTFSMVVSTRALGTQGIMDSYRALAQGIVAALRLLGVEASLVERSGPRPAPQNPDPACFAVKARCDLVVGSAKLVGSAQVQRRGIVLQQNSLPLRLHLYEWRQVFRRAAVPPQAQGLHEAAGRAIAYEEVGAALRQGFASAFGLTLEDGELTVSELQRAGKLAPATVLSQASRSSSPVATS